MLGKRTNPFDNYFDIATDDITHLKISENNQKDNCYLETKNKYYGGFILSNKPNVKTLCKVLFFKSKSLNKYLTRLEFRKENKSGQPKKPLKEDVIIKFTSNEEVANFWKMVSFLEGFKDLVDVGDFHSKYQAVSFENYLIDYKTKEQAEKAKELEILVQNTDLDKDMVKSIIYQHRKKVIYGYYCLLKEIVVQGLNPFDYYRSSRGIKENGDEVVWHHFLKENEWVVGLNIDIKFIRDLLPEQKVGEENTAGRGSPKSDFLGISYFTSLIELKTSKTDIFKRKKSSNSRANTWDFGTPFIEAYSQILGQKNVLNKNKEIIGEDGSIIDTQIYRVIDPMAILIIGNRNREFPHDRMNENNIKSDTFERFRRDSRNVEIVTFDELFERAFHMVFSEKLERDWYFTESSEFIAKYLS